MEHRRAGTRETHFPSNESLAIREGDTMHLRTTISIASMLMAGALFTACKKPSGQTTGNSSRVEKSEIVTQRTGVLEEAQQKREARTQELKAMDVPHLAQQLAAES